MKSKIIPLFVVAVAAPLHAQTVREWTGSSGGAWLGTGNWFGGTFAGDAPSVSLTAEGLATDIMTTAATNSATNIGINMNTLAAPNGAGLVLGGIHFEKTNTTALQIGNSSTTVNGSIQLNGATINSVANTLVRVAGSANLTLANVNTGTGTQTMGVVLGITNGIFDVAASRTLTISSKITGSNPETGFIKTGAGTLTLATSNVANELSGNIIVKEGTLSLATSSGSNAGAAGTAAITLGDTTGSAAATLTVSNSIAPTNALTIAAGSSGVKTLTTGNVGAPGYNGAITLNDNLTVAMLNIGTANTNFTFAGSGNINLNARTLNLSLAQGETGNTNTAAITLNKPVVGTGSIVISGSGLSTGTRTVALSGTNTYTGGTTVGGTGTNRPVVVNVSGDQSAATGGWNIDVNNESSGVATTVNFAAGSTLGVASGKSIVLGGTAGHFSARTLNAAGTVTNNGTLLVRRSSTVNVTGAWTQNGNATIATQGGGEATLAINTGGSFTYTAAGTFWLNTSTSDNALTTLHVNGGTFTTSIAIRNNTSSLSAANSAFAEVLLNNGGTLRLSNHIAQLMTSAGANIRMKVGQTGNGGILDTNGFDTTIDRQIIDITDQVGKLAKQGAGTLTLTGNNTYTGTTTISAGTLQIGNGGSAGTLGSGDVVNDAALVFNRSADLSAANAISGSGTLGKQGAGTLTLTGNNTYAGTTTISAGTMQIGNGGSDGTLGSGDVINDAALVFNRSADMSAANAISGSGTLGKQGAGTLTLTGNNTYTGATLVSAGTLLVNGSLGNTAVTVANDATIGGTGSLGGSLTLGSDSYLRIVDLTDSLAVTGTITFGSGFGITNLVGIDWDIVNIGTHTLISTTQSFSTEDIANFGFVNRISVGTLGREAYFTSGSLALVVIPEPAAALLGALGLITLLRRRRG
jgi:fibronectin-binding autotransporter adhesin